MELREGQDDQWRKLKSVLNPKGKSEYPTLITKDEHGEITKAYTTETKLDAFASKLEQTFTREGDTTKYSEHWKHTIDNTINHNAHFLHH